MSDLLQKINARLQHYNRDELMALIWDFLSSRDEDELADFLDLMRQKSRPVVVGTLELEDADDLLRNIQELHDAIANDEYVQYGSGYDPDYGEYRGFGDDRWIDEMDSLFAATTSLYRAGNYQTAAAAYIALFKRKRDVSIYLTLRTAAQASGSWAQLYPQLTDEVEQQVLAEVANRTSGFTSGSLMVAALLGYAHLLEGQIERAVGWAVRPDIPVGWMDGDLTSTLASGLLRMGLAAARAKPDEVLRAALSGAPPIIREQGEPLDASAQTLSPNRLFDGAVRVYERLLERAVDGRKRESYALAGSYAKVIRAIRTLQGRTGAFDAYYQRLFDTYPRLPAFKDELRMAIEGPGYQRKR